MVLERKNVEKPERVMETIDSEGNLWRIVLYQIRFNRFQLSFYFNDKEFLLSKLQSIRSADDIWDLLCRIKKSGGNPLKMNEIFIQNEMNPIKEELKHEQQATNWSKQ